jgi:hypothetical protein
MSFDTFVKTRSRSTIKSAMPAAFTQTWRMEQSRVEIASPWKHFIDRIGILRFYTDPKYQQWISATQAVGEYQAGT